MTDDPQPEGSEPKSIWQPLDGSAPRLPDPAPAPLSFSKPDPRPLTMPAPPQPAVPRIDPRTGQAVFVLGGWGQRLGAYLLDNLLFGFVVFLLTLPGAIAVGMTLEEGIVFLSGSMEVPDAVAQPALAWGLFALQVLGPPTIAAVFLSLWRGQTPGKRVTGLRVVTEEGAPMSFGRALQRELVAKTLIIGALTVITFGVAFLANYLWPLRDPQNRAGHDFFAKTRVVTA